MKKTKWERLGIVFAAFIFLMTGCGVRIPEVIVENSVIIEDDGSLKAYIVENFDSQRYKTTELYAMAEQEAKEYCSVHGEGSMSLESVELLQEDPAKVCVVFTYASADDYTGYNEGDIYYGTVKDFGGDITAAKSRKDGSAAEKNSLAGHHILVTDEKAVFYCPYSASYVSVGVVINENGAADTRGCEGTAIIILSK